MCSRCYIHGLHFIAHIPIYLTYTIAYLNILRISPEFSAVQCISFFRFGRVSYYAFHTYHADIAQYRNVLPRIVEISLLGEK